MRADLAAWLMEEACREREFPRERGHGYWPPPYAHEQAAVEHAAQMADRYMQAFQQTLQAMRDLRRYPSPVTINNPHKSISQRMAGSRSMLLAQRNDFSIFIQQNLNRDSGLTVSSSPQLTAQ
ncbi:MAG: hypothetical protein HYR56_17950 [Acidobacteria bacterium]|nr:hypothetical protein [Acidobacteriota bacterium]MBI3424101.1 hypothetical protein [Acidobacteriota bacterium]